MASPDIFFESEAWKKGFDNVAGIDEVGRGSFAGPIVAACVVFQKGDPFLNREGVVINDSKKLNYKQRKIANEWIKINAIAWSIEEVSAKVINRIGMSKASKTAVRRAVNSTNKVLKGNLNFLLLDAFYIPNLRGFPKGKNKILGKTKPKFTNGSKQLAIIKGDQVSISIAAASIIAKVHRDKLMEKVGSRRNYRKYDWPTNKGYASKHHRQTIVKYGTTGYHRTQFVDTYLAKH